MPGKRGQREDNYSSCTGVTEFELIGNSLPFRVVISISILPLHIESSYWLDTEGEGRFTFEKEFMLTPRLALTGEAEFETENSKWETKAGLEYMVSQAISLAAKWHSDFGWGVGAIFVFR